MVYAFSSLGQFEQESNSFTDKYDFPHQKKSNFSIYFLIFNFLHLITFSFEKLWKDVNCLLKLL